MLVVEIRRRSRVKEPKVCFVVESSIDRFYFEFESTKTGEIDDRFVVHFFGRIFIDRADLLFDRPKKFFDTLRTEKIA